MKIIITGGSGLIGSALCQELVRQGYDVGILTRKKKGRTDVKEYYWDNSQIESGALENMDVLVHLAGAGIADEAWSGSRKKELISSRVDSLKLIQQELLVQPKALVGGSAIGFYGADRGEEVLDESSVAGTGFLAECCQLWEEAYHDFPQTRKVIIRTGLVLSENGGILEKMSLPIRLNLGAALGTGKQWMSWIHIQDLVALFIQAINDASMEGVYNGVSGNAVRNMAFTTKMAVNKGKKVFLPPVPAWVLKVAMGERAEMLLGSANVISKREFKPIFKNIDNALLALSK